MFDGLAGHEVESGDEMVFDIGPKLGGVER